MKSRYLAVYDYGTGGVWAVVAAPSKEDVLAKFPVLKVFDQRPAWMSQSEYDRIVATMSFDLDDEPPTWLALAMKENNRR